jgi:tetratricopeptide (TPR) repeat protein
MLCPPKRAEVRVGKTTLLSADVSRFYPSIYTQAIEWALSSKAAAKARISGKRPPRTIGAEIDALVQACQNGQTRGIPIGPASSMLLGEIILAQVDLSLAGQGIGTGFRAVDDYELLFDDRSGAERALTALEDALAEFELELNPQKTRIVALPQELENPGIQELRGFRIRDHNRSSERSDLLQFFTRAFARQREFPDKSILRYAVAALVDRAVHAANAALLQSLVLQAVMAEPGVWPFAVHLLSELHKLHVTLPLNPIHQTISGIISKCAPVRHSSEVAWSLWAALVFEIVLPENAVNAVVKMLDDCCAIMLFHMAKRNLCEAEPDATPFAELMDAESLRGPHWLMFSHLGLGHFDPAIAEGKRALELDPLSLIINADFASAYFCARRFDEAERQARKTLEIDPNFFRVHYYLGEVLQFKGRLAEAIPEYQKAFDLNGDPYSLGMLGQAYARNGQKDEAQKVLARLNEQAKSRYVAPYAVALVYLGLGDKERALDELERAYQRGDPNYLFRVKVDPILDDLRGNPRFEALVDKLVSGKP